MPSQATSRSVLVDEVIDRLRADITAGRWPIGARIPAEAALVAELGVARGTVREAVRALAHAGLLQVRQGDGTYVRATTELAGAVQRLGSDLQDVQEVRGALDPQAARLAAERISDAQLADLDAIIARRADAWSRRDRESWLDADVDFHQAIADASGNPLLSELYAALTAPLRRTLLEDWHEPDFNGGDPRGHEGLVAALHARDPEAAARSAAVNIDISLHRARLQARTNQ
ncbi:FadR/GntR family transcriptional regulator [Yinghuangia seranimata]|uniref:FadR/GntR family transcriptional regulator n=1 Tax=Yinghuangia seranimata TaxID=408067 RepID=UPI00248AFF71|nr:FadR/GntR family transcriptional regulator [Yinghuangia seranimata]MDI2125575.1 FadR/GntR family transcriptional regulator [Yinghuangia seranimata]